MDPILLVGLLAVGLGAGVLGTLFGIGGGIIFIPILTILYDLSASEAVAVSLVGIIAASTGAASHFVKKNMSNVRLGLLLEITTSIGAMLGAMIAVYLANWVLLCIFGVVLIYSGITMIVRSERIIEPQEKDDALNFEYINEKTVKKERYSVKNVKTGLLMCTMAGAMSSMTGVGGGTIKVPLMNVHMHVPIKIASATSSYMIGITAFSGAIIYFLQGDLLLDYAAAIAIGAFLGSLVGTRLSKIIDSGPMRRYFSLLLFAVSVIIFLKAGGVL